MKATFTTPLSVINQAIKSEGRHHESGSFSVGTSTLNNLVVVEGKPQTIMFLIGEIAGYGEDGLISVEL